MLERGNALIAQQQWQPALDCFREIVRLDPGHALAHATVGNLLRQLHEPEAALAAYERALAIRPDYAEVHFNRGGLLYQSRQLPAALASFDAALAARPDLTQAHGARGDVLAELGRWQEALASYDAALATNARYVRAWINRGAVLQRLGQPATAEASFRQALALDPANAGVHAELGSVLLVQGKPEEALASLDRAIELRPDFARALGNRGQALARLGRQEAARASHDEAVRLDPGDAALQFNRAAFLCDAKEPLAALEGYEAAIALRPDYATAYYNIGGIHQEAGQWAAALEAYSQALSLDPGLAQAFNNRGCVYRALGQFAAAALDFRRAIAADPDAADAHFNNGQLALLLGDFNTGWPEYEWRRKTTEALEHQLRTLPQPAWTGSEPLAGKRILLHAEQGLGDTIQFCRYVRRVAALSAEVVLEIPASLAELLAGLEGVAQFVLHGSPVPQTDYRCSLMSLPGAFRTTLATIPSEGAYLYADPSRLARVQSRLGPRVRPRVGLSWSGNPRHSNDRHRSLSLARLTAFLPEGCDYFCVQKDIREADQGALRTFGRIATLPPDCPDFADTAALIASLDVVVSVDTSVCHLAGALGARTWILLPCVPDWRWLLERRDSPWYPSVTLYRQPSPGDWDSVLTDVRRDLLRLSGHT